MHLLKELSLVVVPDHVEEITTLFLIQVGEHMHHQLEMFLVLFMLLVGRLSHEDLFL